MSDPTYVTTRAVAPAVAIDVTVTPVWRKKIDYGPDLLIVWNVGAVAFDAECAWSVDDSEYVVDIPATQMLASIAVGECREIQLAGIRGAWNRLRATASGVGGMLTAKIYQFPPGAAL